MPKLKKSIEVDVPVRVAYDQWTQFEEFPSFMEGVQSVQQLDEKRLHWRVRVGMLAPISWRVPPRHYGPWERVVSLLTEGLVERGLDVTLFATADSLTSARLDGICPRPLAEDESLDPKLWGSLHIANAFEKAASFDLIHNHYDFLPLSYGGLVSTTLDTTIHGFSSNRILPAYRRYDERTSSVSISDVVRDNDLHYVATVYHVLD